MYYFRVYPLHTPPDPRGHATMACRCIIIVATISHAAAAAAVAAWVQQRDRRLFNFDAVQLLLPGNYIPCRDLHRGQGMPRPKSFPEQTAAAVAEKKNHATTTVLQYCVSGIYAGSNRTKNTK